MIIYNKRAAPATSFLNSVSTNKHIVPKSIKRKIIGKKQLSKENKRYLTLLGFKLKTIKKHE